MIIAWDFDGVLNRNQIDGRYVWETDFEHEVGQSATAFGSFVFADRTPRVITGEIDILERLEEWTGLADCRMNARQILEFWLDLDAKPDHEMLALVGALKQAGTRQVIATNNEAQRAAYIAGEMGMDMRVERIFASGTMGIAKPDPDYFTHITAQLGVGPDQMFFVDDLDENIEGARAAGWTAFHFTPETREALIERLRPGDSA